MKRLILNIIFTLLAFNSYARIGLSESFFDTPGGHLICDCDNMTNYEINAPSILGFEDKIPRIEEFYFYKNHIIGYTDSLYFIFDESSETLSTFQNKDDWESELEERNLNPIITRWLDLDDSPEEWYLLLFFGFFISIPVILTFTYFFFKTLIRAIRKERFSIINGSNTRAFIALSIILMWFLIDLFWFESI